MIEIKAGLAAIGSKGQLCWTSDVIAEPAWVAPGWYKFNALVQGTQFTADGSTHGVVSVSSVGSSVVGCGDLDPSGVNVPECRADDERAIYIPASDSITG